MTTAPAALSAVPTARSKTEGGVEIPNYYPGAAVRLYNRKGVKDYANVATRHPLRVPEVCGEHKHPSWDASLYPEAP